MSFETINNGDTGLVVREKLNEVIQNAVDTGHLTDATAHGGVITTHNADALAHSNALNQFLASLYTKFLRFDSIQALTSAQAATAAHNLMMQGAKNGYTPEQVDNLNPEQNCFGFTKLSTIPGEYFFWIQNYVGAGNSPYTVQTRLNGMYLQRRSRIAGGAWTAWTDISGGGSEVEPYSIAQIPPNPTNAQMITATGGAGNLFAAIEQGRPIYGYWGAPGNLGAILAASYASNVFFLVIPNATLTAFRCITWSAGNDPTETTIGRDPVYSTTGLYALTSSSTTGEINAAIGSWDNLTAALQNGNTIIDTTAGYVRSVSGFYKTENYIVLHLLTPADTQHGNKEVRIEIVKSGEELALIKTAYNIFTDTAEGKAPFVAANTGNSTDAGKVPVCGSNGKLSPNILPPGSYSINVSDLDETSTSEEIATAIGGWENLYNAVSNGTPVYAIEPTEGLETYSSMLAIATESSVVYLTMFYGSLMSILTIVNDDGTLSLYQSAYDLLTADSLPAASMEALGAVVIAENTGNSTDAGKVFVAQGDGKIHQNALPAIVPATPTEYTNSWSSAATVNLPSGYDVYNLQLDAGTTTTLIVKTPTITAGSRYSLTMALTLSGNGSLTIVMQNSDGTMIDSWNASISGSSVYRTYFLALGRGLKYKTVSFITG